MLTENYKHGLILTLDVVDKHVTSVSFYFQVFQFFYCGGIQQAQSDLPYSLVWNSSLLASAC